METFVGIDVGSSEAKGEVVTCLDDGREIRHRFWTEDSLSETTPAPLYAESLDRILKRLNVIAAETTGPIRVFLSAAGFSASTRDVFRDALRSVGPSVAGGRISAIGIANDAVVPILGHDTNGIVIAGTGSTSVIRASSGSFHQIGGRGNVVSDFGSGYRIGRRGAERAYYDMERWTDSVLRREFRRTYGIDDTDEAMIATVRGLTVTGPNAKKNIARFAKSVCETAGAGDIDAQTIVRSEAEALANDVVLALTRHVGPDRIGNGVRILRCGSIFRSDYYRESYERRIIHQLGRVIAEHVTWLQIDDGTAAALNLARSLTVDFPDTSTTDLDYDPVVVRIQPGSAVDRG